MSSMMLPVTQGLLRYPILMATFIIMVSFGISFVELKDRGISYSEIFIALIKCGGYGLLAWFILVNTKELQKIDVLTYFTFLLACVEVGHNFANSFGLALVLGIKILYWEFLEK